MSTLNRHEQQFFKALQDLFVGAKIEGDSGYINLMWIKSNYFSKAVHPHLMRDIDVACKPYGPTFREELFEKLYDFFSRYFNDSGSIYYHHSPHHHDIYERVYTEDRDVILFWKTHMLYYVKTDRLFKTMKIIIGDHAFLFQAGGIMHKLSNEKRNLTFALRHASEREAVLSVNYSERGSKTNITAILKGLHKKGFDIDEETLVRACRIFERQGEVDFFINKNARVFLREQFDLWLYQYVFSGDTEWREARLLQLAALKSIAYKIIDFIAHFEDELVKVWNKPKFVLNSHYVVSLNKITDEMLLEKLISHPGMAAQLVEWIELGMVDDTFELATLTTYDSPHQYLPLDTRHFPDLELDILALFDDIDEALDGWLVHSENYQALNTLLPKFKGQVKAVYIDPPYNSPSSEIIYLNRYKEASWLTLLENRLQLGKEFLRTDGVFTIAIDDLELNALGLLVREIFPTYDLTTITVVHNPRGNITANFSKTHEYALFLTPVGISTISRTTRDNSAPRRLRRWGQYSTREERPTMFYPIYVKDGVVSQVGQAPAPSFHPKGKNVLLPNGEIEIWPIDKNGVERRWNFGLDTIHENLNRIIVLDDRGDIDLFVSAELTVPKTVWTDSIFDAGVHGSSILNHLIPHNNFTFPKSVQTVFQSLEIVCRESPGAAILDFFAGSGTTAHAVINLNREDGGKRKYILVEMGEHFYSVILPRIKKVIYSDKWKSGKAQPGEGVSHFVKYFALEQYDQTLKRAHYDSPSENHKLPFDNPYGPYIFLRDLRFMQDTVTVDIATNNIQVDLTDLYQNIDLAETLSCITGKGIRRVTRDKVEFQDGSSTSLRNPDWELVRPLLWW